MTDTPLPLPEAGSEAADVSQDAAQSGWRATNSDTIIIRQMTEEQLAHYRDTGDLPASADIPLVEVTDVASQQPDAGAMPFNRYRKK